MSLSPATQEHFLVLGGSGFLGRHVVEALIGRGEKHVAVFDVVQRHFEDNVDFYTGSIEFIEDVSNAISKSKADVVIHTASPIHGQGADLYRRVNVEGTKVVIDQCIAHGVKKLVYTSSAGVVYNGDQNLVDVDERMEIPAKALDAYNKTKAQAETMVLDANGRDGLKTVALRPAGIFGPGDRQGLPAYALVIERGQTKFQIGNNTNPFDFTYVGNVAHAHLLASDRLDVEMSIDDLAYPLPDVTLSTGNYRVPTSLARPLGPQTDPTEEEKQAAEAFKRPVNLKEDDSDDVRPVLRTKMDQFSEASNKMGLGARDSLAVAGNAFFITNAEPVYFWDFVRANWKGMGHIPPTTWKLSTTVGLLLASLAEVAAKFTGKEPGFTRFRVKFSTQKRFYNVERARRLLEYEPIIGVEEGLQKTLEWWNAEQAQKAAGRT